MLKLTTVCTKNLNKMTKQEVAIPYRIADNTALAEKTMQDIIKNHTK